MPVFVRHDTRLLFIHVPKTGGSFVEAYFVRNGFSAAFLEPRSPVIQKLRRCSPQHYHAELLKDLLKVDKFHYRFMTVRDPLKRIISEYGMRNKDESKRSTAHFTAWLDKVLNRYTKDPYTLDNHIRPQSDFLLPNTDIFRQEDRYDEAWVEKLSKRAGIDLNAKKIVKKAANSYAGSTFEIHPDDKARIRAFYARDYETFGYS